MMNVLGLILGFILLVKGADLFVSGASSIAKRFGIPSFVIGVTIVAFGTSAPELAVSVGASIIHANQLALGNVIGSNIFNLLVVLGFCSIFYPIKNNDTSVIRDWMLGTIGSIVLILFCFSDYSISAYEGVILTFTFLFILYIQLRQTQEEHEEQHLEKYRLLKTLLGLGLIVTGGQLVVTCASNIALLFGLSETLIGLTICAIGTSLPELVTSIVATRKGETSIAIGNVIGSNIFNIYFILGLSSMISPISTSFIQIVDCALLAFFSCVIYLFMSQNKLNRKTGIILLASYIFYLLYVIIR